MKRKRLNEPSTGQRIAEHARHSVDCITVHRALQHMHREFAELHMDASLTDTQFEAEKRRILREAKAVVRSVRPSLWPDETDKINLTDKNPEHPRSEIKDHPDAADE